MLLCGIWREETLPGSGLYRRPKCSAASEIGVNKVVVWAGPKPFPEGGDIPLTGKVYNLVQPEGLASDFGVALPLPIPFTEAKLNAIFHGTQPAIEKAQYFAHTLIEGHVEWAGDYHDYYEIAVSSEMPLIASRLESLRRQGQHRPRWLSSRTRVAVKGLVH